MRSTRKTTLRLLYFMLAACVVLPAALFAYIAWRNLEKENEIAVDRLGKSLDVLHEHALKVLGAVELVMSEILDSTSDLSNADIAASEFQRHTRFAKIAAALPQIHSIWLIDEQSYPLVSSYLFPAPRALSLDDRDYFQAQKTADAGVFVGEVLAPRFSDAPAFFSLSRRRQTADGRFQGVVTVSISPAELEKFYATLAKEGDGRYFAVIRADGEYLARFPVAASPDDKASVFMSAVSDGRGEGMLPRAAQLDQVERIYAYRRLSGHAVYVVAGYAVASIEQEWVETIAAFGSVWGPFTLALFGSFMIAVQRTRKSFVESAKREAAEAALVQALKIASTKKSQMLIDLRRNLAGVEERERLRIARELHDETGQSLAVMTLDLRSLEKIVPPVGRFRVRRLRDQMEQIAKTLHSIAWQLRPTSIDDCGLVRSLENYIAEWSRRFGIEADFHCTDPHVDALPDEARVAIFRVVQEALTNVAKHAGATMVSIVIERIEGILHLTVEDDGCGFHVDDATEDDEIPVGGRLGLAGMRERVHSLDGEFKLETSVGVGTTIFARLPVGTKMERD